MKIIMIGMNVKIMKFTYKKFANNLICNLIE